MTPADPVIRKRASLGCAAATCLLLLSCAHQRGFLGPLLAPTPSTSTQHQAIEEGIRLQDQGDVAAAVARYQVVLDTNPDNVLALYELASAQMALRDYAGGAATARRGTLYRSDLLPQFYTILGNCYDLLGDTAQAIRSYKTGLGIAPHDHLIYFNMGVSYARHGDPDGARNCFKKAVSRNPEHASSHFALADIYYQQGYRIPALLAYFRFLVLEPVGKRAATALFRVNQLWGASVTADSADSARITLAVERMPTAGEGDFNMMGLELSLLRASRLTGREKGLSERELLAGELGVFFRTLGEQLRWHRLRGFAWRFYAPFFADLTAHGYAEAFVHYAFQYNGMSGIAEWTNAHVDTVQDFVTWSKAYQWDRRY